MQDSYRVGVLHQVRGQALKVMNLTWRYYSELSGWALKAITRVLIRKRMAGGLNTQKMRKQYKDRGRDWNYAATSQRMSAATTSSLSVSLSL